MQLENITCTNKLNKTHFRKKTQSLLQNRKQPSHHTLYLIAICNTCPVTVGSCGRSVQQSDPVKPLFDMNEALLAMRKPVLNVRDPFVYVYVHRARACALLAFATSARREARYLCTSSTVSAFSHVALSFDSAGYSATAFEPATYFSCHEIHVIVNMIWHNGGPHATARAGPTEIAYRFLCASVCHA